MYKLLIVDDNNVQIKSLLNFVDWRSFDITDIRTASNGSKGVEMFREFMPDIVITDVVMPVMDGIAMTKAIREIKSDIKIVYISCYEDAKYLKDALDNKVASYILKPIDPIELTGAIADILNQLQKDKKYEVINKKLRENLRVFGESFLFRLLYSGNIDFQYATSTLKELDLDKYDSYAVVRFKIESDVNEYMENYILSNYIKNTVLKELEGFVLTETKRYLNLIIMGNDGEVPFFDFASDVIVKAINTFRDSNNIEFSVGFSKPRAGLLDVQLMLRQAAYVLDNNLDDSDERIYFFINFNYLCMEYTIVDLKATLNGLINRNNPQEVEFFLDRYWIKEGSYRPNDVKNFCLSVLITLQFILNERNFDFDDVFGGRELVWEKLEHFETIQDARRWLYNILNAVISVFANEGESRQEKIVAEIKTYIEKHYGDVVHLEQIASNVYVSPSYAKSLFKKITGKTISDYLNQLRMTEAKKLLLQPNSKVYEVAKKVGYKSKPYFIKAFKKHTGQLPSEYQNMNRGM